MNLTDLRWHTAASKWACHSGTDTEKKDAITTPKANNEQPPKRHQQQCIHHKLLSEKDLKTRREEWHTVCKEGMP